MTTDDPAAVVLLGLGADQMAQVREQAAHIREVLTGFRSGSAELALPSEPQPQYEPSLPLLTKYATKAAELGISKRTLAARGERIPKMRGSGARCGTVERTQQG